MFIFIFKYIYKNYKILNYKFLKIFNIRDLIKFLSFLKKFKLFKKSIK